MTNVSWTCLSGSVHTGWTYSSIYRLAVVGEGQGPLF